GATNGHLDFVASGDGGAGRTGRGSTEPAESADDGVAGAGAGIPPAGAAAGDEAEVTPTLEPDGDTRVAGLRGRRCSSRRRAAARRTDTARGCCPGPRPRRPARRPQAAGALEDDARGRSSRA